ncbi:MAG: hypothetical protein ACKVS8_13445 [Phycisphaerales bacterium]
MNLRLAAVAALAGSLALLVASGAQPAAPPAPDSATAPSDNLRSVLDMFRSDLNGTKVRTLNQVMQLTAAEAEKFWPVYKRYEVELGRVDDRRVVLIREFVAKSAGTGLTDAAAADIASKWLTVVQDRLDLWKKYHGEISAAVSPIRAAQFLQTEHQIALFVDLNIASEMPVVGQPR